MHGSAPEEKVGTCVGRKNTDDGSRSIEGWNVRTCPAMTGSGENRRCVHRETSNGVLSHSAASRNEGAMIDRRSAPSGMSSGCRRCCAGNLSVGSLSRFVPKVPIDVVGRQVRSEASVNPGLARRVAAVMAAEVVSGEGDRGDGMT